jgi:large subunit ribosomal protein L35
MAKIKMKSHRGAAKRFRVTAKGRVKFRAANRSHNFLGDNGKKKRGRRSPKPMLCKSNEKVIRELLLAQ